MRISKETAQKHHFIKRNKVSFTSILKDSSAKNHNTWVCSLCYPFALELGKIYGCGSLIYQMNLPLDTLAPREYSTGKFALLGGQGHRDDEIIIFDTKPRVEIEKDVSYKSKYFYPEVMKFSLQDSILIYEMAVKHGGYTKEKDGYFEYFFIQKIHDLITRWEKKNGNLDQFYIKFVEEREIYLKVKNA